MNTAPRIALLLADVDGTLVTHDKLLTARARAAVSSLKSAGIAFAITSGRPPKGMQMLFEPLDITTPIAGFNGGMIVNRDLSVIQTRVLPGAIARHASASLRAQGLDVWAYVGNSWLVTNADGAHVARESWTVKYGPDVVANVDDHLHEVIKIVGVSDDPDRIQSATAAAVAAFGSHATIARSQPYYLDITHPDANKGCVVAYLADRLALTSAQIATIGDQPNDVTMFRQSGFSIAMGNATDDVKQQASVATDDSEHEGFAEAVERLVLDQRDAA